MWFITLFSYCVQETTDSNPPQMLMKIWDSFLLKGWKTIFKTAIFIIKEREQSILEESFEDSLTIMSGFSRYDMKQNNEGIEKILAFYKSIKITNTILKELEKEYDDELNSIND